MTRFKFARWSYVRPLRWLDGGAPKGINTDSVGVIVARTPAAETLENRNYYTVKFGPGDVYEVAENDLRHDNDLDHFTDGIR